MLQKFGRLTACTLFLAATSAMAGTSADAPNLQPKPASPATVTAQKAAAASLPEDNGSDTDFATRGFIATRADPVIRTAQGRPVWDLNAYDFVRGPAPDTVNPSLWREVSNLNKHGLFQVADGVWQVRGFDISNMTVIRGATGWILVDPLTTKETSAAALELVNQQLGERPVVAVIYSHSHADHFGGARGVASETDVQAGKTTIIAPAHFTEETASENVMAGAAMGRRAAYQFGVGLPFSPTGQMGSGIGLGAATGEITLIEPTDTISRTGETRVVDGVKIEFQIVSGSEAPSELNLFLPDQKVFLSAEMSTCTLHNVLTPRGAKVRDTHAWAGFLDEALQLYGGRAEVDISSHCWPIFGQANVAKMLAGQRDNYRYLHDQTVRLMNQGETQTEIAEELKQPKALADQWYNHGYYGTYSHNSKAVYQFYLGWYDANPANLNPLPPVPRAQKYVAAMGGPKKVIALARKAMAEGDYRWSAELLNQLVFADPTNKEARALLADSYEQLGYQSESAIWRNQYLVGAKDLREGFKPDAPRIQSADIIGAVPTALLLDSAATRFDPAKLSGRKLGINLVIPDRKENAGIELSETTMIGRMTPLAAADATITAPRPLILALLFQKAPLEKLEAAGLKVEGNREAVKAWLDALDPMTAGFNIIEP